MWPFTKKQPSTVVHSAEALELHRLMTDERDCWERVGYKEVRHLRTRVQVDTYGDELVAVRLPDGRDIRNTFSYQDLKLLQTAAVRLCMYIEDLVSHKEADHNRQKLRESLKLGTKPKDETARQLAYAVLKDDDWVAAKALADRIQELVQEGLI